MSDKKAPHKNRALINYLVISSLGLALCSFAPALSAQQDQPGDVYAEPAPQDQQNPQGQVAPNQDMQQGPPQQGMQQGPPPQGMQQGPPPQGVQPPPEQAVPSSLTLPAGTMIRVRVSDWLSSDRNVIGDGFSATLDQPIVVDGWVVARRGQAESGRVSQAQKAGHASGSSKLGLELTDLTVVDGQQLPVQMQMLQASGGGTSHGRDAATIGTTTGIGAAIGAVADGGPGAAIGAGAGAAAGIIGVLSTPGKPTVIFPESVLTFRLQNPVTISTDRSQNAFQPVTQSDYDPRATGNRPQRLSTPGQPGYGPPPPPPYYGYPYAYVAPYPYPYYGYYPYFPFTFGFYGGYGFGGRFGGYRGFRR